MLFQHQNKHQWPKPVLNHSFLRSRKYRDWLHQLDQISYQHQQSVKGRVPAARRFDTCWQEGHTSNPCAPVSKGLPEDFYTEEFIQSLGDLSRKTLEITARSSCLEKATQDLESYLS